jgi:hypothetical protein
MGQQSNDIGFIVDQVKHVIENCCVTPIDVDTMPTTDVEFFFLHLRAKSVGETAEVWVRDPEDGKRHMVIIDLEAIEVSPNKNKTNTVDLGDGIGITLKPATLDLLKKHAHVLEPPEKSDVEQEPEKEDEMAELHVIQDAIESIYDAEKVYDLKSETQEEIDEFLRTFTSQNLKDIETYFNNMPKVTLTAKYTNSTGAEKTLVLEGLPSFFQLG